MEEQVVVKKDLEIQHIVQLGDNKFLIPASISEIDLIVEFFRSYGNDKIQVTALKTEHPIDATVVPEGIIGAGCGTYKEQIEKAVQAARSAKSMI